MLSVLIEMFGLSAVDKAYKLLLDQEQKKRALDVIQAGKEYVEHIVSTVGVWQLASDLREGIKRLSLMPREGVQFYVCRELKCFLIIVQVRTELFYILFNHDFDFLQI